MKKLIAAMSLAAMSCAPAFAGDDPATNTVLIPVRILAFGVGAVIGTPVSIVKHSLSNTNKFDGDMADKVGGKDNAAARIFMAPGAIVGGFAVGAAQGLIDGPKNSVDNCVEHPFSTSSMSLSDSDK